MKEVGHQYNFKHIMLVTKYKYKMFKELENRKDNTGSTLLRCGKTRNGNKSDVVWQGLYTSPYGNQHTKYDVNFVCSAAVEGILVIYSIQRNASTQIMIFQRAFLDCMIQ